MRFSVEILLSGNQFAIPSDYRRNILSLIKEAINPDQGGTEIYEKYYVKKAIKIKAPAPVLQLIYDAGIGAKRSQGFGMLEIM